MRAAFGLVGLLVVTGVILLAMFSGPHGGYVPTALSAGAKAQDQGNQLAGRDSNGVRAQDSIALEETSVGGSLRSLRVKNILPLGPMETVYGLKIGDEITGMGPVRVRDQSDSEMAKDLIFDAFGRNEPLVIQRNGQEITLNPNSALTQSHPDLFAAPGAVPSVQAPPSDSNSVTDQLNKFQQVPTH